jgi:hypothetical protein
MDWIGRCSPTGFENQCKESWHDAKDADASKRIGEASRLSGRAFRPFQSIPCITDLS